MRRKPRRMTKVRLRNANMGSRRVRLHAAQMDDFDAAISRSVLRTRLGPDERLRRADAIPAPARRALNRAFQNRRDANRALARQLGVVAEPQRLDRLIVSVAHDHHPAWHL